MNSKKEDKFYINQFVKIKNNKKLFDKFHQQYSDDVYQIVKIFKNSLNVENNDIIKVKKSDVIIVDKPEDIEIIPEVISKALKESKIIGKLKQEDINENNTISTKRIIKKLIKK
jgi:hypothetical protein